jgi:hypothetical protein
MGKCTSSPVIEHDPLWPPDELVEFSLFLTGEQARALEAAACRRGLTAAQMLRRIIRELGRSSIAGAND